MSDIRNLNRVFGWRKAIKQYNKAADHPLSGMDINVLLSLHHLGKVGPMGIDAHLIGFYRRMSMNQILEVLGRLQGYGYVLSDGSKHSLTLSGINAIKELERRCREARYDK
jgi:hypothetical protein